MQQGQLLGGWMGLILNFQDKEAEIFEKKGKDIFQGLVGGHNPHFLGEVLQ